VRRAVDLTVWSRQTARVINDTPATKTAAAAAAGCAINVRR